MTREHHFAFTILVLGAPGVGKASFISRHMADDAPSVLPETTETPSLALHVSSGIHFRTKDISSLGRIFRITYGHSTGPAGHFRMLTASIAAGVAAVCYLFDLTDPLSFEEAERVLAETHQALGSRRQLDSTSGSAAHSIRGVARRETGNAPVEVLIGTKLDLAEKAGSRKVTGPRAERLARLHGMSYFEVSSLTGTGVFEAHTHVTSGVTSRITKNPTHAQLRAARVLPGPRAAMSAVSQTGFPGCCTADRIDSVFTSGVGFAD
jgi:GTPase SAR1 family protein